MIARRLVGRVELLDRVYRQDGRQYGPWLWRLFKRAIDASPGCAWVRRHLVKVGIRWNGTTFEEVAGD